MMLQGSEITHAATIFHTVVAIARYSASAEDHDTIDCFLVCQDIRAPPNMIKYSVHDRRVKVQPPQSASQKNRKVNTSS